MHAAPALSAPRSWPGPSPWPGSCCPPRSTSRRPPTCPTTSRPLLDSGIDDWGGVSPVTIDHVNPERAWPALDVLAAATEAAGLTLAPRLTIYPEFALDPDRWLDPAMRFGVLDHSDAEGLARDHPWCSGGTTGPPALLAAVTAHGAVAPRAGSGSRLPEILAGVTLGQEVGEAEIVALFSARGPEVRAVAEVADELRAQTVGDVVTWVANRNINYTNVCTFKCRFCAFSKGPLSLNLRGAPYLLELSDITDRVREAEEAGATEVCLQGGIHPNFDGDYYLEVIRAVRAGDGPHPHPRLHRPRGHRGGQAPGRAPGRLSLPVEGGGPRHPAGDGGRDPRRRGPRRALPRQDQHRASGWRPTAPPIRSGSAPT